MKLSTKKKLAKECKEYQKGGKSSGAFAMVYKATILAAEGKDYFSDTSKDTLEQRLQGIGYNKDGAFELFKSGVIDAKIYRAAVEQYTETEIRCVGKLTS